MVSSVNILQCDFLHLNTLPHVFTSERAEQVHINKQINSIDSHISQLILLRDALHHRLHQLHNLRLPIHSLPVEVLSYIFQQLIDLGRSDYPGPQQCLTEALVLSSVSSHFRHVALGTPELWKTIPLYMTTKEAIGKVSSLLRYCIAVVPSTINVAVFDALDEEDARSAIDILFTPDVTQKIRAFELSQSTHAPSFWTEKLKGSSFPILDTLEIKYSAMDPSFDFGTLKTLTRVHISNRCLYRPIIVPESVQYLDIRYITPHILASLLYLCPNLVGCMAFIDRQHSDELDDDSRFTEPLTLNHLKRLTVGVFDVGKTSSFMENLRLPSLEILRLHYFQGSKSTTLILLCRNVSATLMSLVINKTSGILDYDDLHQLCGIPFPKLRTLIYFSTDCEPFMRAIYALALPDDEEHSSSRIRHLPALKTIKLYDSDTEPRSLLDLLKEWKIGDAFYFHIKLNYRGHYHYCLPPELREELRSIVGDRRIEVTWGDSKV